MATEKSTLVIEVKAKDVDKATKKIENLSKSTDKLETNQNKATQSTKALSTALDKQKKASGGALNSQERMNRSAGNMGQKAGLAAIQIEQLVGQIAGGQNPMRAFGQQSADIGFVLGKPMLGAVVGVASALGSLFLAAVLSADHSLEKLQETSEALNETFIRNSTTGAYELSTSLKELSQQSKGLARMQVILFNLKVDEQLEVTTKATRKEFEKFIHVTRNFDSKIAEFNFEQIGKSANATGGQIKLLRQEFAKLMANTEDVGDNFTDLMANIFANAESDEAVKFLENMGVLLAELRKSRELANLDLTVDTKSGEEGQKLIDQLKERFELEKNGYEQVIRNSDVYLPQQKEEIIALREKIDAQVELNNKQKEADNIQKTMIDRGEKVIQQLKLRVIALNDSQHAANLQDKQYDESHRTEIANLKEEIRQFEANEKTRKKAQSDKKKKDDAAKREEERIVKANERIAKQIVNDNMSATDKIMAEHNKRQQAVRDLYEKQKISDDDLQNYLVLNTTNTNAKLLKLAQDKADKQAKAVQDAEDKARAKAEKEARIRQNTQELLQQYMPNTVLLKAKYEAELEVLKEALAKERITLDEHNRSKAVAQATYKEEKNRLENENHIKSLDANQLYWATWLSQAELTMTSFNDITREGIEGLQTGLGGAFEQLIIDGEGIKSVVAGIFENMARAQIAALGQMAAERLTHFLVGKALEKTAAASGAAAMVANATASQQMAALNAYMSTAAIPIIGATLAPAAAATAMAATAPFVAGVTAGSIAGTAGRALGGQVRGGESYIVGERGAELLTMPSNTMGRITPNSSMGGGQLNVTVENYGSSNISVQKISETDVRIIAREVATQTVQREAPRVIASDISNPNGRVSKTLANNTNTQRRR